MKKAKKRALKKMAKVAKMHWESYKLWMDEIRFWMEEIGTWESNNFYYESHIKMCRENLHEAWFNAQCELAKFRQVMRDIRATR